MTQVLRRSSLSESWLDQRENQLAVVGETLARTPGAIYDEVMNDLENHPGKVVKTSAISAAIGYGATILLRRAPVVGGIVAGGALLAETLRVGPSTVNFLSEAAHADTAEEREYLARRGSQSLGKEGALFLEALPGAVAGGALGMAHLRTSATARELSYAVAERVEFPLRTRLPEAFYWRGPGTRIGKSLSAEAGTVDALQAGKLVPTQKHFTVEHARIVDPQTGRMSRLMSGTPDWVELGVKPKPGQITVGTQSPYVRNPAAPSAYDIHVVPKGSVGVVNAGEYQSFYIGQGTPHGPRRFASVTDVDFKAVVLDHKNKRAFLHDYTRQWDAVDGWISRGHPTRLSYDDATSALSRVNELDPWKTFSSIRRVDPSQSFVTVRPEKAASGTVSGSLAQRLKHSLSDIGPHALKTTAVSANPFNFAVLE